MRPLMVRAGLACLVAGLAGPAPARADDIALDRLQPAPAGDRFLGVPSPYVAGELDTHAMLLAEYAHRPLLVRRVADKVETGALVAGQAVFHANVALALRRRLLLHLNVPFLALQATEVDGGPGLADFGDLRFGLRARLLGEDASPVQLALGGDLWAPTGTGAYVTDGTVRGRPYVVGGGLAGQFLWSALLGAEIRPSRLYQGSIPQGASFQGAVAAGYLLGERRQVQLGAELTFAAPFEGARPNNTHAELLVQGRYRFLDRFEITAGIGPGLTSGIGTPELRALVAFAYVPVAHLTPPRRPKPSPPVTTRTETIGPETDPAPLLLPLQVEPNPLGPNVTLEGDEIVPEEALQFAFNSADLTPDAERVIHALADYLIAHPEILKVEVRGYADIDGTLQVNERLAKKRAEAVRQALIHHSIASDRLTARGFGPRDPAAASTSDDGRRKNRRVELWVTQRAAP